jgi:hypothetical protein
MSPAPTATNVAPLDVSDRDAATNTVTPHPTRLPLFVPRDDLFFWTSAWQEGERESAAEREAGNLRTFEDPKDLFRWLLSPGD